MEIPIIEDKIIADLHKTDPIARSNITMDITENNIDPDSDNIVEKIADINSIQDPDKTNIVGGKKFVLRKFYSNTNIVEKIIDDTILKTDSIQDPAKTNIVKKNDVIYEEKHKTTKKTKQVNLPPGVDRKVFFFDLFKRTIEKRGGKCISTIDDYIDVHHLLKVECGNEHTFQITPNNLKALKWCPHCKINLGELIAISALEHIFQLLFKKVRPDWLVNNLGNSLELDAFNEILKLAVEYNGIQHYKWILHFYRTKEEFDQRQDDDLSKINKCKEKNINLIVIPYTIKFTQIYDYLVEECKKLGYIFTPKSEPFDLAKCFERSSYCDRVKRMIEEREGIFLGIIKDDIVKYQCKKGHIRTTRMKNIFKKRWCASCATSRPRKPKTEAVKLATSMALKTFYQTGEGKQRVKQVREKRKTFYQTEEGKLNRLQTNEKISKGYAKSRELAQAEIILKGFKICVDCTRKKTLNEYHKNKKNKDGYQNWCKECHWKRYPRKK